MKTQILLIGCLLMCVQLVLPACMHLEQPFPEKQYYLLDAEPGQAQQGGNLKAALRVQPFTISSYCKNPEFVYRLNTFEYESDFYNAFFVAPDLMFTEQTALWLEGADIFETVLPQGSGLLPDYMLEGHIIRLHGDYSGFGPAKAILAMQFALLRADTSTEPVIFFKRYVMEIKLAGRTPEYLVRGWNQALADILGKLETDLRRFAR